MDTDWEIFCNPRLRKCKMAYYIIFLHFYTKLTYMCAVFNFSCHYDWIKSPRGIHEVGLCTSHEDSSRALTGRGNPMLSTRGHPLPQRKGRLRANIPSSLVCWEVPCNPGVMCYHAFNCKPNVPLLSNRFYWIFGHHKKNSKGDNIKLLKPVCQSFSQDPVSIINSTEEMEGA